MKLLLIGLSLAFLGQNDGVEIRGAWRVKSGSLDGEPIKILDRTKHVFVFCDDNKLLIRRTGEPDRFAKVTLGPGLRTKDIDLVFFGDDDQTIGSTGIYKVEGDTLEFAASQRVNGKESRPAKNILTFKLERRKGELRDEPHQSCEPAAKPAEKKPALAGRWELVPEKPSSESFEIEFVDHFFSSDREVIVRRKTVRRFSGCTRPQKQRSSSPELEEPRTK